MATLQVAPPAGYGGVIQGAFGTYAQASDLTFTVDIREMPFLLSSGFTYVTQTEDSYTTPIPPLVATVGRVVASGALSNGTVTVSNQTDLIRPVTVEVGTGASAITAGTLTVTYLGNDGLSSAETYSLACPANSAVTQTMSRGVSIISSIVASGVTGGTAPWFRMSTTPAISVPVAQRATDFGITREYDAGATIAVGSLTSTLGSVTPSTAPNGTVTYSFVYYYTSPTS